MELNLTLQLSSADITKISGKFYHIVWKTGAGDEIRTHDPNLGKVMLYP